MKESKGKLIQLRVTQEEKDMLQQQADSIGVSLSGLLRKMVLSEEKITVFPGGKDILTQLYEIKATVEQNSMDSGITDQLARCADALCKIADHLTDLSDGGDDE